MDEEEIELWYDEEKEKLTEKYKQDIVKGKDKEKLKKDYLRKLDALRNQYEKISESKSKSNLKSLFFNHRLKMLKEKLMKPFADLKEKIEDNKKKPES